MIYWRDKKKILHMENNSFFMHEDARMSKVQGRNLEVEKFKKGYGGCLKFRIGRHNQWGSIFNHKGLSGFYLLALILLNFSEKI